MNYPNKKNSFNKSTINYANRGMSLESDINLSNKYYLENDIAVIYKKPTPIKVVKVDYNNRINTKIKEAYYETPSTTDYNGIYMGRYIDFEAKETKSKTSFSLSNIHKHQIEHLIKIEKHGGISFVIIKFSTIDRVYLLQTKYLETFLNNNKRKSIPIEYIQEYGYIINYNYNPRLEYIKVIDKLLEGETNEKIK